MTAFGFVQAGSSFAGSAELDPFIPGPTHVAEEPNPMRSVARAMRGRGLAVALGTAILAPTLGAAGFLTGTQLYESQAIVRVFPQEATVLYRTGDDSVLKTFDSYVKAETTYIASPPVMDRATQGLRAAYPTETGKMTTTDLAKSIDVKRVDSLITLTTKSKSALFAAQKLQLVAEAYLALHAETEAQSSAVRLSELQAREQQLMTRQAENQATMLTVGGEYGVDSLGKIHADKVAKIEVIATRRDEVESTLAGMKTKSGASSADMANQEILRSTLLDRALADLNFEHAKREAELATFQTRYPANSPQVRDKAQELAVIDRAMADRREQIKVLGQTGALTDTTKSNAETSLAEIQALLDKVTSQLEGAKAEARDLNFRMIKLDSLRTEAENVAKLLEETRQGIEVISVEAGKALPGYSVLMSPPMTADTPAQDNTKMRTAVGLGAGLFVALFAQLLAGLVSRKVGYSDGLKRFADLAPVKSVAPRGQRDKVHSDRLRNALQLHPLRVPPLVGGQRVIAITRLDTGAPADLALSLAKSFAQARTRTLLIDADAKAGLLTQKLGLQEARGWRQALEGGSYAAQAVPDCENLEVLSVGQESDMGDAQIGVGAIRSAIAGLAGHHELVILLCGALSDSVSTELLLSVADLAVAEVRPTDRKSCIAGQIGKLDSLPRQGGVLTFTEARPGDPGLR